MSLTLGQVVTNGNPIFGDSLSVKVDVNGTTIRNTTHTSSFNNCDTFTEKEKNTIIVTWTHNAGASIGIFASSHTKGHAVCGHVSTRKKLCSTTITSSTSPKTCDLSYSLPRSSGLDNGNPIYLERLTQMSTNTSHITKNSLQ